MKLATGIDKDETEQRAIFQNMLGISQPYLSQLLNGDREPSKKLIKKIAEVCGLNFWAEDISNLSTSEHIIYAKELREAEKYLTPDQIKAHLKAMIELAKGIKNTGR